MDITPEMARQELARRELARRGVNMNENKENNFLDSIMSNVSKFNRGVESTRLPSLAGGFIQGAGDIGASLANIPLGMIDKKIPHPELKKYFPQDLLSQGAFTAGELGAGIPGALGLESKLASKLPELTGKARLGSRALTGAISGAALGEEMPGGRTFGALLGGIAPVASAMRPKNIAKNLVDYKNKISKEYSNAYDQLFKTAEEKGIKQVRKPSVNYDLMMENIPSENTKALKKFIKDPTLENAHWAQSDLNRYISSKKGKDLPSEKDKALKEAIIAHKKLKGIMHTELSKEKGLSPEYAKLTKGYGQEVVPYKYNPHLTKYEKGELKASSLVKALTGNDKFMIKQGNKYPELQLQALLRSPLGKIGLGAGAIGLGLPPGLEYLSSQG